MGVTHGPGEPRAEPIATVTRVLRARDLVTVSNREPYVHEWTPNGIAVSQPTGGVTSALDPIFRAVGGTWVAWGSGDADHAVVDSRDGLGVPPASPAYRLRRVWLDESAVDDYYYGYANRVLWPLCHGMPSKIDYRDRFRRRYGEVNAAFARAAIAETTGPAPVVWFHDYHLALAPRLVRRRLGPAPFLLHFWHVPWPSWDVFRLCPDHRELLDGLLANDLLGFHTDRYRANFLQCVERSLDASIDPTTGVVTYDGHQTYVRSFPLGVDAEQYAALARSDEATAFWTSFAAEHGLENRRVALGVDRLDYTKGIVERLAALEHLWETRPAWRGRLTYVQKASETRGRIPAYRELRHRVESTIRRINERFGTGGWRPVVYRTDTVTPAALAGLYRHADVGIVSPLRDGMNLVAKEFVAARTAADGVLVLSELAGAAAELGDRAVMVNPYDTEEFADAIAAALTMPPAERHSRMRTLQARVRAADSYAWVAEQFRTVAIVEAATGGAVGSPDRPPSSG